MTSFEAGVAQVTFEPAKPIRAADVDGCFASNMAATGAPAMVTWIASAARPPNGGRRLCSDPIRSR